MSAWIDPPYFGKGGILSFVKLMPIKLDLLTQISGCCAENGFNAMSHFQYIFDVPNNPARSVVVCTHQMCLQIQRIHGRGVFHLNICASNVMLKIQPGNTDLLKVAAQDIEVVVIGMRCAAIALGINRAVSVAYFSTSCRRAGPADSRQKS